MDEINDEKFKQKPSNSQLEINQGISITHNYNASHMYGCQRDLPLEKTANPV